MNKKLTLKSLLVAALIAMGVTSAWADTFTGTVSFKAQNRITNNGDGTFKTASNAGNQYALALASLNGVKNISGASAVTLEFDVNIPRGSRWYISIGDSTARGTNANGSNKATYNTDGLIMHFGTKDGTYYRVNGGTNNDAAFGVSAHCTFTLDVVNKTYSYTIKDGETELFSAKDVSTSVTGATIVEAYTWLSNATLAISDVSYSFEYSAASYNYEVKAVSEGADLEVLATGVAEEPTSIAYPYAIKVGEDWYTTSVTPYVVNVTAINPTVEIEYTKDESIIGFYEEEVAGTNGDYSNGGTTHAASGNSFSGAGMNLGTFAPGKYQAVVAFTENGNRSLIIHNNTEAVVANLGVDKNSKAGIFTVDFSLYAETKLNLTGYTNDKNKPNQSADFDYFLIKKVAATETEETPAFTENYATYSSVNALDFSSATDVKAYVATAAADGKVTMTKVTSAVPAGTGLLLQKTGDNPTIPVVDEGVAPATNLLKASNGFSVAADNLVFAKQSGKFGFFKLTEATVVPAGKAYLDGAEAASLSRLTLVFDDATAIKNVQVAEENAAVYNLAGQRVANAQKGINIVNGKKYIVK